MQGRGREGRLCILFAAAPLPFQPGPRIVLAVPRVVPVVPMAWYLIDTRRVGPEYGPWDDGYITGDSGFDTQSTDTWSSGPSSVDGQWPPLDPEEGPELPVPVLLDPWFCRRGVVRGLFRHWAMVMRLGRVARESAQAWRAWLASDQ